MCRLSVTDDIGNACIITGGILYHNARTAPHRRHPPTKDFFIPRVLFIEQKKKSAMRGNSCQHSGKSVYEHIYLDNIRYVFVHIRDVSI